MMCRKISEPEENVTYVFYTGNSMKGTFFFKDSVGFCPVDPDKLQKGDVILFPQPGSGKLIVHRICQINSHGIRTVGDNNDKDDPWLLQPADISGLAICRKNARGIYPVSNGRAGWRHFHICQIRRHFFNGVKKCFTPLLSGKLDFIRIQNFSRKHYGDQIQYFWHGLRIGWKFNGKIRYNKAWYRLIFRIPE